MKIIAKRRRIENKTNYTKRRRLLEGKKPRLVIRKTNKYITIQVIESKLAQDTVKYGVTSKELLEQGWPADKSGSLKSLAAAYLTGILFGKKAKSNGDAILDMGLIRNTKGSRIYAALKGVVDSGFKVRHSPSILPAIELINKENSKVFFDKVKANILGGKK